MGVCGRCSTLTAVLEVTVDSECDSWMCSLGMRDSDMQTSVSSCHMTHVYKTVVLAVDK